MTTSEIISIISVSISGIAVVVSVIAVLLSRRANRKANQIATRANEFREQLLRIEQQRDAEVLRQRQATTVIARVDSLPTTTRQGRSLKLTLVNTGNSSARNIAVTLDGQSIESIDWIDKKEPVSEIILGAGLSYSWHIHNDMRSGYRRPPWKVAVSWDTESGERREYPATLNF